MELDKYKAIANAIAEFDSVDKSGFPPWYLNSSRRNVLTLEYDLIALLKREGIPVELIYPED